MGPSRQCRRKHRGDPPLPLLREPSLSHPGAENHICISHVLCTALRGRQSTSPGPQLLLRVPKSARLPSPGFSTHSDCLFNSGGEGEFKTSRRQMSSAHLTHSFPGSPDPAGPPQGITRCTVMLSREDIIQQTRASRRFCGKGPGRKQEGKRPVVAEGSCVPVGNRGSSGRQAPCPTDHSSLCPTDR